MFWRVLVVGLLAVTAGCGTFQSGTEPTATVTPAPVPEPATEATTPTGVAPGVSESGVTDVNQLVAAHLADLNESSYVFKSKRRVDRLPGQDGDELVVRRELRVEDQRHYSFYTDLRDVDSGDREPYIRNLSEYADGERTYRRFVPFGAREFTYERGSVRTAREAYAGVMATPVRQYLAAPNATVAEAHADDRLYYKIESRREKVPGIAAGRNFSMTAMVSPSGFVSMLRVSYDVERNGRVETVRYSHRYYRFRTVPVDRPDWVAEQWPTDEAGD